MRLPDRRIFEGHPCRGPRHWSRWTAGLLLIVAATCAGCAGMPPPTPPPSQLPDDSYSGGSNFGGRPMRFGLQV